MMSRQSLAHMAMDKKRDAHAERRDKPGAPLAGLFEREATELLELHTEPDVGAGGEVVREQTMGLGGRRSRIRNTLAAGADRIAEDASIARVDLLAAPGFAGTVATGIDAAESIEAQNSIEKMLAHQLAVAHEAGLRFMDRALRDDDSIESARLANTAARLMTVFQTGMLTLQRLRTGGTQVVTVQHVNVEAGAQAVIGNVSTPGAPKGRR
jgi:hypothetical protein